MDLKTRRQRVLTELPYPQMALLEKRADDVFVRTVGVDSGPVYALKDANLEQLAELPDPQVAVERSADGTLKPEVIPESPRCRADGTATLWYRHHERKWQSVTFEVSESPSYLFRLGTLGDGKVIGSSEDPYSLYQFDPARDEFTLLGPSPNHTHVYAFQGFEGKGYFVGYYGAPLWEWDPNRPWTALPPDPDTAVPDWTSQASNPRLLLRFDRQHRSYDIVLGGDDRLYVGCSADQSVWPGGMLGWYDLRTGESDGTRNGFEQHRADRLATALEGRYVVAVAVPWPPETDAETMLVTYDTQARQIIGRVPLVAGSKEVSAIVEWRPGVIAGCILDTVEGAHTFYLFDVERQHVSKGLDLEGDVHGKLLKLPDGRIAFLDGDTIGAVDCSDWSTTTLCSLDRPPRDWMRLDSALYLILDTCLARIQL